MPTPTVTLKLDGLRKFARGLSNGKSQAIVKTLKQWKVRYLSFAQRRFDIFSKGGGDWPPLAPSTIARRKGKGIGVAILRDTGTLFRALTPLANMPGSFEEIKPEVFTITVGYGGSDPHPSSKKGTSIANIAMFHNFGMGHNPTRLIIAQPDENTKTLMTQDAERNLNEEARREING